MRKWMAVFLAACTMMLCGVAPAEGTQAAQPTDAPVAAGTLPPAQAPAEGGTVDGTLRVWLQSLGNPSALGLTLDGAYAVDGDRGFQFEPQTEIALGIDGEHIVLKAGGAAIDMGGGFTLTRHLDSEGGAGGAYIHESQYDTLYMADLSFAARNGGIRVIATIQMEEYLYGVVPYEMSTTFPLEALKAQAVAARTYAMQRKSRNTAAEYDLVDTANDQVFKGLNVRHDRAVRAVDETRGMVGMLQDGSYAECFYTASNGGQTALASDVWGGDSSAFGFLDICDDPYDLENPESIAKTATILRDAAQMEPALYALILDEVAAYLHSTGDIAEGEAIGLGEVVSAKAVDPIYGGESRQYGTIRFLVKPVVRRFLGEETDAIRMLGELETLDMEISVDLPFYDQVRSTLGIGINARNYDLVDMEEAGEGFRLVNRRSGHGVGLSQRGAQWMAEAYEMDYLQILGFYYPGLSFVHLTWEEEALTPVNKLPQSLGYAAPRPTPAPTPGPLPALQNGEYYAVVTVEGVDGTLRVREGPSTEDRIIGEIRNGSRMIVEEETPEGWAKMKTAELDGYVLMTFIEKEGSGTNAN